MKTLLSSFICLLLMTISVSLDAQKTYKAVCDKGDGKVKIVDGDDRSPNLVPLKGGFPFYQVADKWVKENYPDGRCDPAAAAAQNQAAANAAALPSNIPAQPATVPSQPPPTSSSYGAAAGQSLPLSVAPRYRNTSMFISFLFSDLGKVYSLDPPMIPGMNLGIEQIFGTKFYGGTGIQFNTLIGKTDEEAGVSSFYFFRIPLFAGYRLAKGNRYWGVDLGLAANTMLRPLSGESTLAPETASDVSFNTMVRARFGGERRLFELGADLWLDDILASHEGYQMMVLILGYRFNF